MNKVQEPTVGKTLTVEPTVRKTLTVATSRIHWQLLMGLVAGIVVMSMVVPSRAQLHHVPPAAPTFTVLYSFAGPTDGAFPVAGLVRDAAGNLYGTTAGGGASSGCSFGSCGVVFKLAPAGSETVLHSFTGGADGGTPSGAGLVRDAAGNLYGTTTSGGTGCNGIGCGVVFKLSPTRIETVLYSFTGGPDGQDPYGGLTTDAAGNLYGTAVFGGSTTGTCHPFGGCGVVFELIRCDSAASGYEFKVLYSFTGGADGARPVARLVRDAAGNLYGTTANGGATSACYPPYGCGVVFKLSPSGTETVLHSFSEPGDGAFPGGLVRDAAGNLYGTGATITSNPFVFGAGTVFKLSPNGTETVLYSFTGGVDGGDPNGVVPDSAGNLYGTTQEGGGSTACNVPDGTCGVVFKLSPSGTKTVLHSFTGADGGNSSAGLLRDAAGNLYGTTQYGGANTTCFSPYGCGVVFKLAP
jgi:uncharacterized repeat protein (TIGR03803 family)